jgi:hypothetical protein
MSTFDDNKYRQVRRYYRDNGRVLTLANSHEFGVTPGQIEVMLDALESRATIVDFCRSFPPCTVINFRECSK